MIEELCTKLNLGKFIISEEIKGGLTNSLYKVTTDKNIYAIKKINANNIAMNPNLLNKIELSETISNIAKNHNINVVSALMFFNKYVQNLNDNYFLIYEWCDGVIYLTKEITLENVKSLSHQLSMLHNIKVTNNINRTIYSKINYRKYYEILKDNNEEWISLFVNKIDDLCNIYETVYSNYLKLSNQKCYVHKDYNRKNVLWKNSIPYIIDWETSTIDNPSIDFFNSAWFLTADVDRAKYHVFIEEYFKNYHLEDDIEVAAYASIIEECNWLEYSLKRAIEMESLEQELGKKSITPSLKQILEYYEKISLMIEIIQEVINNKNIKK